MITQYTYLQYNQCPKYMWYANESKSMPVFNEKIRLKPYLKELFHKGVTVPNLPGQFNKMAIITENYLKSEASLIHNPIFVIDDIFIQFDVMVKKQGIYHIYDLKATTKLSKRFYLEMSFIKSVLKRYLNLEIKAHIVYVNKNYVRIGKVKASKLLIIQSVDKELKLVKPSSIQKMKHYLSQKKPEIQIGTHCERGMETIECPYKDRCHQVDHANIFDLAGMHKKDIYAYFKSGIFNMEDIKDFKSLPQNQRIQIECLKENIELIDKKSIHVYLQQFKKPLYFLDFEAFRDIIPPFNRTSPNTEIPFLYSVHILDKGLSHKGFIGKPGEDPRRKLAEQLICDIPKDHQILAYNMSYEKRIISQLAHLFPDLKKELMKRCDAIIDLEVPFAKKWYYTNDMKGKYSIKNVLPALFPDDPSLDYKSLKVSNGLMAMTVYRNLNRKPNEVNAETLDDLWQYCHLDTLAMVRIYVQLQEITRDYPTDNK